MKRLLSPALILPMLFAVNAPLAAGQQPGQPNAPQPATKSNAHDEKIYSQLFKLGVGRDVTVKLNSGKEWHGRITSIEETRFKLVEVDLQQVILITYRDTRKVEEGYTEKNVFGKRIDPHTKKVSSYIVLAGVIGFFAVILSQIK